MRIQAVIFDLDGVLCHTDRYHYLAWKVVAEQEGIPFTETDNHRLRGVSRMESLDIILEKAGRGYTGEEKQALAERKNERYKEYLAEIGPADLVLGARETIQQLRAEALLLAIGSSSKNAGFILKQLDIFSLFDAVSDGNNIMHSKPDPEVFLCAAKWLRVAPDHCLVVEDAVAGVEAAQNAGMVAVAIGEAAQAGIAGHSIRELCELPPLVKAINTQEQMK